MTNNNQRYDEHYFSSYSSKLGDALFPPGNDNTFYDIEARSYVSELLCLHKGNIESARHFLTLLDTFTPEIVQHSLDNPSWSTQRTLERWKNITKPMIEKKVMTFFPEEFKIT